MKHSASSSYGRIGVCGVVANGREAAKSRDNLRGTIDQSQSSVTFRVLSLRATRLEVWIYDKPFGAQEKLTAEMAVDPQRIWSRTISLANLAAKGVTDPIYYGYRAWGPNWTFDPSWTKGSQQGFVNDVDSVGSDPVRSASLAPSGRYE